MKMHNKTTNLGAAIKAARKRKHLTQMALSEEMKAKRLVMPCFPAFSPIWTFQQTAYFLLEKRQCLRHCLKKRNNFCI